MNESIDPQSLVPPSGGPVFPELVLYPMSFGQILDRIYRLMRAHFRLFFGIAAFPSVVLIAFTAAWMGVIFLTLGPSMGGNSVTPPVFPLHFLWIVWIFYPIFLALYALYLPAACFAATQADLGVALTIRQAYEIAWSRFGRSVWLMILYALYVLVPVFFIAALIGAGVALLRHAAGVGSGPACAFFLGPLLVLLYLGILVYCVLILLRFAVAYPACMEEDLTARASLRRSASLTRGAKGRIFLVLLVVYAVTYGAILAAILVLLTLAGLGALAAVAAHVAGGSPALFLLVGLGALAFLAVLTAATMFSYAAFTTSLAVLYHDQRLRRESPAPSETR
jgi:hypothetical protein